MQVGSAELEQGHYDASIDELHKAIETGYRSYIPYANLAAAYALQGKMDEAKSSLAEARRINPSLTVMVKDRHSPNLPKAFDGMRKARLPEEPTTTARANPALNFVVQLSLKVRRP